MVVHTVEEADPTKSVMLVKGKTCLDSFCPHFVGKMAFQGDSIACIVEFGKFENGRVPVAFTLNGETIYEVSMKYEKGKRELYPFIGMGHNGIRVLAKVRNELAKVFQS